MTIISKRTLQLTIGIAALAGTSFLAGTARADDATEKIYKAKCVSCHAADGSGTPIGKKLGTHDFRTEDTQKMSDDELTAAIAKGKNKMPGYEKSLKPDEIKGLVAYVRAFAKK